MAYANNNGVKIYYEVEGEGPPLMMGHGVTRSLERWRQIGFADALKNDYRLIMFDARGHGKSDKPHDPAAYGANMVDDVQAVLDAARIDAVNYMGYSMGAGVGFMCAIRHPERFNRFVLGGWSPYRAEASFSASRPPVAVSQPPVGPAQQIRMLRSDPDAYLRSREQQLGRPLTPEEKETELANDPEALGALMATFRDFATLSNQDLSRISTPCLLYAGESDTMYAGAKEASSHIPNATFFSLPGLDHVQAGASPLVLPYVKEFLAGVNRK
jgi:pimeloyl-ACP methyl ester carboxylesterase